MAEEKEKQYLCGVDRLTAERLKKMSPEGLAELEQEAQLYAKCFSTQAGREVLKLLEKIKDSPAFDPRMESKYGYWREGQNDIIRHINIRINFARSK